MVLGLDVDGESKAFPLEVLRRVRIINDTLGGKPIIVIHQPRSDTTTAFLARARNRTVTIVSANADGTELVDQTGSAWSAYGECVAGPLKGLALPSLILEPEYWFAWSEFHRGTKIFTQ